MSLLLFFYFFPVWSLGIFSEPACLEGLVLTGRDRNFRNFFGGDFQKALKITNKYHDVIAVTLNDPREGSLPDCGLVELRDAENNQRVVVDSSNARVRQKYEEAAQQRFIRRNRLFASTKVDHIDVSSDVPYAQELVSFFARRKKRH